MARATRQRLAPEDAAEFRVVLRGLWDKLFVVVSTLGVLAIGAVLVRAARTGWRAPFVGDVAVVLSMIGLLALRRRLGEVTVFWGVTALMVAEAAVSLGTLGLASAGLLMLTATCTLVSVFRGLRAGLIAVGLSLVLLAAIAAAVGTGLLSPFADPSLLRSPWTWATQTLGFAGFTIAAMAAAASVQRRLLRSLGEGRERTAALDEAVARLRESERRYRLLAENATDVVFLQDRDLGFAYASPSAERLFGYPIEELLRLKMPDVMTPGSLERAVGTYGEYLARAERGPVDVPLLEFEYVRKDGSRFPGEMRATFLRDERGAITGTQGVLRDVTERKRLEGELRQADKLQAIGRLAGGVAHDFNNQLAVVTTFAELIRRDRQASPRILEAAESILAAARRSADLTRQLLAFARRSPGRAVPVEVHGIVREIATIIERSVDRRIRVRTELEPAEAWVRGDPSQLSSALLNLAINARDAMPEGGELTFASARRADGREIEVRVADTGVGMDDETRRHLFEPFFTTKDRGRGTGLGLAAVYGTVESHGGTTSVESAPGAGATFRVRLPLVPPSGEASASVPAAPVEAEGARGASIVLVDDEELLLRATALALGTAGHSVAPFSRARPAIEHYARHWKDVDVVILDVHMPEMGADRALAELRAVNAEVAVLLVSGAGDARLEELRRRAGVPLLEKPFRAEELLAAVERLRAPAGSAARQGGEA